MICNWPTCDNVLRGKQTRFCSPKCKNKFNVTLKRRRNKEKLVEMFGGQCVNCGYNKSAAALCFHHTDDNKSFAISDMGKTPAFDKLVKEAQKCILICANCHAEIHHT